MARVLAEHVAAESRLCNQWDEHWVGQCLAWGGPGQARLVPPLLSYLKFNHYSFD